MEGTLSGDHRSRTFVGVDPSSNRLYWASVRLEDGALHYVGSGKLERQEDWSQSVGGQYILDADILAVEKPGGALYGKFRYNSLIDLAITAGMVYGFKLREGRGRAVLVDAHGSTGWRTTLLKSGSGRRKKGQEVQELEYLLMRLVKGLPTRNGRLKGVLSEHKRDALGIAVWAAVVRPKPT